MQDSLFGDLNDPAPDSPEPKKRTGRAAAAKVQPGLPRPGTGGEGFVQPALDGLA